MHTTHAVLWNRKRATRKRYQVNCRRLFAQDWGPRLQGTTQCSAALSGLWGAWCYHGVPKLVETNGASECNLLSHHGCRGDRRRELQRSRRAHWPMGTTDAAARDTSGGEAPGMLPFATMRSVPCDAMQARCWHKVKAEGNLNLVFDTACQAVGRSAAPPGPQIELAHNSGHHLTPSEPSQAQAFDNKLYA